MHTLRVTLDELNLAVLLAGQHNTSFGNFLRNGFFMRCLSPL
jgi:hypothetical protein